MGMGPGSQFGPNLSPDIRYFVRRCMDKGANPRKARRWAQAQVAKGKRKP